MNFIGRQSRKNSVKTVRIILLNIASDLHLPIMDVGIIPTL